MKLFYTLTVLVTLTTTSVFSRNIVNPEEGIKEDIEDFVNEKIVYKAVDAATPLIKEQVHNTFRQATLETVGTIPDLLAWEWDDKLKQQWTGENWVFIGDNIVKPIKQRAITFKQQVTTQVGYFFGNVSAGAEAVNVEGIKRATKEFFAVGDAHHVEPAKVNSTLTGVSGMVQHKLEQYHANVMLETSPLLAKYVQDLGPSVSHLVQSLVQNALVMIVGDTAAHSKLGASVLDWITKEVSSKFDVKIDEKLAKASLDAIVMTNKIMRTELYKHFPFLKGEAERINQNIK